MTLPKNVYLKHSAYYYVANNKWYRLTDRLKDVPSAVAALMLSSPHLRRTEPVHRQAVLEYGYKVLTRARNNAKGRRKIEFSLTRACLESMLVEADWRCAVTGASFSLEKVNGALPFALSIDRIDNALGYTRDNCRVVCVAANYAMNVWGEGVLWRLFDRKPLDIQLNASRPKLVSV